MPPDTFSSTTAAIVLIGNELLSGKFRDENAAWLAGRLRTLGVDLRRIVTVPDIEADIVDEVRKCAERYTHVFTSGGVGPTHDDITIDAIARAFDVPLVRDPTLEHILQTHFKDRLNAAHLRMANVPAGTTLQHGGSVAWPIVRFRNVIILPGVPEIFRAKFEIIASTFQSIAFHIRNLWLNSDEGEIAALLEDVERAFGVQIGSYPRIDRADHRVRITVEARRQGPVDAAVAALLSRLAPAEVVRVDPPGGEPEPNDRG